MFKKKKNNTNYDHLNGYVEAYLDIISILKKQKNEYGNVVGIDDMLNIINNNVENLINRLLSRD